MSHWIKKCNDFWIDKVYVSAHKILLLTLFWGRVVLSKSSIMFTELCCYTIVPYISRVYKANLVDITRENILFYFCPRDNELRESVAILLSITFNNKYFVLF
jgi:hypothetical protein